MRLQIDFYHVSVCSDRLDARGFIGDKDAALMQKAQAMRRSRPSHINTHGASMRKSVSRLNDDKRVSQTSQLGNNKDV